MTKSKLFLIPTFISENQLDSIAPRTIRVIHSTKHYIVERARTARRFIKQTHPPYEISELEIIEFSKENQDSESQVIAWLKSGISVGVISESGMPGIADPGQTMSLLAHQNDITVESLVGPSSLSLALCASGLNGQNFAFKGYLPIKENELKASLKAIQSTILKTKQTQLFIETPYRNNRLIKAILNSMNSELLFCIAMDITGESEFIKTKTIGEWKESIPEIGKAPCIFLLGI